ncbi:MAG: cohesin domain-containing protein [Oscillibacter sp.]|nr:cohesin domain-containing protein [Oscillibacter sp.]
MAAGTDNGKATITVETVQKVVKAGEEVTLNVSIAGNPGFAAFDFTVKYDGDKLELTKAEKGNIDEGKFTGNKDTGKVNLFVDGEKGEYTENGVLFTLTFKVKADVAGGTKVTLEKTTFKNAQNVDLSPTIVAGGINVTTGGSTTGGTGSTTGGTGSTTGGTGSTGGGSTGGGSSSGSGSSYTSGMSFTTDLPADSITRVTVNGKKLDSKYYTVSSNGSGSIVTLTDAYLATLKAGTYTIKIESATHVSTGTFTIKADGTPKTADAGIALYAVMAVSSLMGTAVVSKKCRKA